MSHHYSPQFDGVYTELRVRGVVAYATVINISVIPWRSVLLVEETGVR